jgi:sulfur carrier protein
LQDGAAEGDRLGADREAADGGAEVEAGPDLSVAAAQGGGHGVPERAMVAAQDLARRLDQFVIGVVQRQPGGQWQVHSAFVKEAGGIGKAGSRRLRRAALAPTCVLGLPIGTGMADDFTLTLNGETHTLSGPLTVAGLLGQLGLDRRKVAVERNEEIVPRSAYDRVLLSGGDALEIVHFIGGG